MSEQLEEKIWKWCGFIQLPVGKRGYHWEHCIRVGNWMPPDETEIYMSKHSLPSLTLDNLFKWAVPKLDIVKIKKSHIGGSFFVTVGSPDVGFTMEDNHTDPALALALAIEKVIDAEGVSHE